MGYMTHDGGDEHWHPPIFNSIKVNVDAAIFEESDQYSYATVIKNHAGELIEARSRYLIGHPNPDIAEAIGIREALSWVKEANHCGCLADTLTGLKAVEANLCFYAVCLANFWKRLIGPSEARKKSYRS